MCQDWRRVHEYFSYKYSLLDGLLSNIDISVPNTSKQGILLIAEHHDFILNTTV